VRLSAYDRSGYLHSSFESHDAAEKADLLRTLFSNCSVDANQVRPTFKKPYDLIFKRAGLEEWSRYLWEDV
jgi:hypothetical protein